MRVERPASRLSKRTTRKPRVRNGRNDCAAARTQDQTRLAPRSRMAWANPHGLRHRRRLRVPGQDLPIADQDRARHYRRPMVRTPLLRADEKVGDCNSDARQTLDRRGDAFGELKWLNSVKTAPRRARRSAAPSTPANLRRRASSRKRRSGPLRRRRRREVTGSAMEGVAGVLVPASRRWPNVFRRAS